MDPGKSDEGPSLPKKIDEEKGPVEFELPFRVVNLKGNTLNLVRPVQKSVVDVIYPTVCFKEESAGNDHAFNIMFNIPHDNILSMMLVCENKLSNDNNSVATFVEPYDSLRPLKLRDFADAIQHIPSPKFQSYLRQIIIGLDHLRTYDLYHGNLSWDSTLKHGNTIKLAGFRSQELKSKTEAQWGDWISLLGMLEVVLDLVRNHAEADTYFCGHLVSLINMMKTLNRESLPTIKDTILEQMFFWDKRRRLNFFSYTISLKLKDANFMERVAESRIRKKGWDKDCTPLFQRLVKKANNYHEAQRENTRNDEKGKSSEDKGDYNGNSLADYVKLICGSCTHHHQLELDVDTIIRENHPTILSDIKEILEAPDHQDSPGRQSRGHQSRGASQHQNIPGPSRGHTERQSHPSRGHMERQSPYSSRGASQHQNIPGPLSERSQQPSYGSRGASQHQNIPGPSSVPPSYGFYHEQQSERNYSQQAIYEQSQENYMLQRQYYAQLPMAPEGGYQQQPHPYAGQPPMAPEGYQPHPYAGLGQWPVRGAPYPYPQHYPAYYPPVGQAGYPYQAGYDAQQVGQARLGYPQQYPYRYGSTAPAAGQAAPAVRQPPYGQSGIQPPTNRPRPS